MASFWTFYAFEQSRWDRIFGGGYPQAAKWVIASATAQRVENLDLDYDETKPDPWLDTLEKRAPPHIKRIAETICKHGVSYAGLDERDAAELDGMVPGWFSPEGLENALAYRMVYRNGLSPKAVAEMLDRARPGFFGFLRDLATVIPQLSAFEKGRRFGDSAPSLTQFGSRYFIYTTEQAVAALGE